MVTKINLCEITITELNEMIRNKTLSIKEIVSQYLEQIDSFDKGSKGLNAILEINPDALTIAEELDGRNKKDCGLLYGVPILLKDNINTADNLHTSAGSLALADSSPATDAEIVKILRKKGAVILGKTNMTEFANYMTKGMPDGYSSKGGIVKSPYVLGESPAGSSTGSGVAVTANLCMAALGTDTSGSIISPGLKNGIVGYRPSQGALSIKGIAPISFTLDMVGPMTRTVEDAIIIFNEVSANKVHFTENKSLRGTVIGIDQSAIDNMSQEEEKKANSVLDKLKETGATLKRIHLKTISNKKMDDIKKYEFKYAMNQYLAELPLDYKIRNLKDIIEFNDLHREETLKYGQILLQGAQDNTSGEMTESIYLDTLKDVETTKRYMKDQLKDVNVCIVFKDHPIVQYTGLPAITVPCGLYNDGMPFGINIIAQTDEELLNTAYAIEQTVGRRVKPKFIGY
ncbi:amidase family protein [Kineothrix sp. MB12-C1]|uniref:amidase family protein n=1 Tax=Kineothrix sp. MB12-C1 TaxID=3070215 RepID=UPI0027D2A54B|nr:amidase family protein [Kineothrix sp. MB12-C1]WMC93481.1 amidase family protein [Kineothrix sp. MB12-C1]